MATTTAGGGDAARLDAPAGAVPGETLDGRAGAQVVAQPLGQGVHQPGHAAGRGQEHRAARLDGLRPQRRRRSDEAGVVGVTVAGRGELHRADLQREVIAVAGVDAAHERADEAVEHLVAQSPADQVAHALVGAAGRAVVGRHEVQAGAGDTLGGQHARGGHRVEVGGHAQELVGRQAPQIAVVEHVGRTRGRGHQLGGDAQLGAELDGLGHPCQEGVGGFVELDPREG